MMTIRENTFYSWLLAHYNYSFLKFRYKGQLPFLTLLCVSPFFQSLQMSTLSLIQRTFLSVLSTHNQPLERTLQLCTDLTPPPNLPLHTIPGISLWPSAAPICNQGPTLIPCSTTDWIDDRPSTITFGIHDIENASWDIWYYEYGPSQTKTLDENVSWTKNRVWTGYWKKHLLAATSNIWMECFCRCPEPISCTPHWFVLLPFLVTVVCFHFCVQSRRNAEQHQQPHKKE